MVHAVLIRKTGPPDVLELVDDYEKPTINDGEWKKGDRVLALTKGFLWENEENKYGTYADYTASKEEWLAKAPYGILLNILGGIPLVALTALQALESGNLKPGARVLVHGGAGGVGHMAIQLAKVRFKAYVVTTAGPANQTFIKEELGADEVLNYKEEDFAEKYKDKPFDLVIDAIGGTVEDKSYTVLAPHGTYTHIMNNNTNEQKIKAGKEWKDRKYILILADIKLVVDKIFWLKEIREAHKHAETAHSRGKVVVQISHEE
ncbi:NAD(P)-binding protein [Coccomyxa subellipsoidea C-169]|uniref:NAD(P)-binding protein n=1 Tax=Coccomyxa subellipsoidea (strain C-169) TaxID=574566 RepID=I0YLA1_COCSC|nr:NAD(P)-binding protein [Coccomyxa subellipsoidea C-169]EIE19170.1 NAD(P)-binding protein [Coccomyxa subellipsoidea C-169]|eukprot:XP_005643714.1 NAD(P)-binding protein [Coccomyxa subellipsoidea C-169]